MAGLGWGCRLDSSNKFPGDTEAARPGAHLEKPWVRADRMKVLTRPEGIGWKSLRIVSKGTVGKQHIRDFR